MGVLDDAIRQHLELKRQHGASEDEVRDQAAEALGSPHREAGPPAPGEADGAGGADAEDVTEPVPDMPSGERHADLVDGPTEVGMPPVDDLRASVPTMPVEPLDPVEPFDPDRPIDPDEPFDPDKPFDPDEPLDPDEEPLEPGDREAPAEPPADEEAESDDVLEETPDFLQETPEHDRLWFEQKPPRDFEFDE